MIPPHIPNAKALETSHQATVDGFLSQSLTKTGKAGIFVTSAQVFEPILAATTSIKDLDKLAADTTPTMRAERIQAVVSALLCDPATRDGIIKAAQMSQKACEHLTDDEINANVKRVLTTLTINSAAEFRTEILYRTLLAEGDALGGQMRNYIGAEAGEKLTNGIIDALRAQGAPAVQPATLFDDATPEDHFNITKSDSQKIVRVSWDDRLLLFDVKPTLIGKNIDVILLDTSAIPFPIGRIRRNNPTGKPSKDAMKQYERTLLASRENYLACGELKGGIDPAGADEHWKTARSALDRIQDKFPTNDCPALFFVAAAIQEAQANEIFARLQNDKLTYAANLTQPEQLQDLAEWLVSL